MMHPAGSFAAVALLAWGCEAPRATPEPDRAIAWSRASASVSIEPRHASIPTYPCKQCHTAEKRPPNPKPRKLDELHTRIHLEHGSTTRWCYSCHADGDMNALALPDGRRVGFDASHDLCGACHGEVHGDWRRGIHGLTTGHWNGEKTRRSCTHCHDPHRPRSSIEGWSYALMPPRPPPKRQGRAHEASP